MGVGPNYSLSELHDLHRRAARGDVIAQGDLVQMSMAKADEASAVALANLDDALRWARTAFAHSHGQSQGATLALLLGRMVDLMHWRGANSDATDALEAEALAVTETITEATPLAADALADPAAPGFLQATCAEMRAGCSPMVAAIADQIKLGFANDVS